MSRKLGDWNCRACHYLNFSRRDSCQQCGNPRIGGSDYLDQGGFGGGGGPSFGMIGAATGPDVKPGDWYCYCGVHNFASRSNCFKCGAFKLLDDSAQFASRACEGDVAWSQGYGTAGIARAGWKSGDWICNRLGCNEHNYASRTECFRCNAPRGYGTEY